MDSISLSILKLSTGVTESKTNSSVNKSDILIYSFSFFVERVSESLTSILSPLSPDVSCAKIKVNAVETKQGKYRFKVAAESKKSARPPDQAGTGGC